MKRMDWTSRLVLLSAAGSVALCAFAQEGHPLTGSWSGEREVDGKNSRVLVVMDLQPDQSITGYVLEQGKRLPLEDVTLNPGDWSVSFRVEGYSVEGTIEDLGSAQRTIDGTWTGSAGSGEFDIGMN